MRNFSSDPTKRTIKRAIGVPLIPVVGSLAFVACGGKTEQTQNAAATAPASPAATAPRTPGQQSPEASSPASRHLVVGVTSPASQALKACLAEVAAETAIYRVSPDSASFNPGGYSEQGNVCDINTPVGEIQTTVFPDRFKFNGVTGASFFATYGKYAEKLSKQPPAGVKVTVPPNFNAAGHPAILLGEGVQYHSEITTAVGEGNYVVVDKFYGNFGNPTTNNINNAETFTQQTEPGLSGIAWNPPKVAG